MATLVVINQGFREEVEVALDFDSAVEKVFPVQPPASNLEARVSAIWPLVEPEGAQALIHASLISMVKS